MNFLSVVGEVREKVYFPFEDTPLFVDSVSGQEPIDLHLNTGETIPLDLQALFVYADQLYQRRGDERIKFSDRALMAIAAILEETADGLVIRVGRHTFPICGPDAGE